MNVQPTNNAPVQPPPSYQKASQIVADALVGQDPVDTATFKQAEAQLHPADQALVTKDLISKVAQAGGGKPEIYLSTPITGGDRLYDYLESKDARAKGELSPSDLGGYASKVIHVNCAHAHRVAEKLRAEGNEVVEPSEISLPGWNQTQYNANWTDFVGQLPLSKVEVCDGWQLSYGCLLEVRTALDHHIPVVTTDGKEISRDKATHIVDKAVQQANKRGFEVGALSKALTDPLDTLQMEMK